MTMREKVLAAMEKNGLSLYALHKRLPRFTSAYSTLWAWLHGKSEIAVGTAEKVLAAAKRAKPKSGGHAAEEAETP